VDALAATNASTSAASEYFYSGRIKSKPSSVIKSGVSSGKAIAASNSFTFVSNSALV